MAAKIWVSFLCLKGPQNKKSSRIFCVRQVYLATNLVACKPTFLTYFLYITCEVNSTMRRCFFVIQTSDRIFSALFRPIILQFFTILQDNLHSFNQSRPFRCTTNQRIDHIIKLFHQENAIMQILFSQKNMLLCDIQDNKNGLLVKTIVLCPLERENKRNQPH